LPPDFIDSAYPLVEFWWLKFHPECSFVFHDRSKERNISREAHWRFPFKIYCLDAQSGTVRNGTLQKYTKINR
jgi:hypothetical protein